MSLVCKKCSNGLIYEPESQNLVCKHCGNVEMIERNYDYSRRLFSMEGYISEEKVPKVNMSVSIKCVTCGAINNGEKSTLHDCIYCGARLRNTYAKVGANNVDGCLPFVVSEHNVRNLFKEQLKKKKFLPNDFKKLPENADIQGLYYMAYKFNIDINASYKGDIVEEIDGESLKRRVIGNKYFTKRDIIIEGSSYMSQDDFESLQPYDYSGVVRYDERFIAGFDIEASNRTLADVRSIARNKSISNIRSEISKDYEGKTLENLNIKYNFMNCDYSKLILPVYKITYNYGNKKYMSFINGQTGKLAGRLPKSGMKIFLTIAGILLAVGGVIGIILNAIK